MGAMPGASPVSLTTPSMVPPLETATTVYGSARAACARSNEELIRTALRIRRLGFTRNCIAWPSAGIVDTSDPPANSSITQDAPSLLFFLTHARVFRWCRTLHCDRCCRNGELYPRVWCLGIITHRLESYLSGETQAFGVVPPMMSRVCGESANRRRDRRSIASSRSLSEYSTRLTRNT